MKEEALRLADAIDEMISDSESYYGRADEVLNPASDMIRKLVAEIDTYRLKNSNQIDTYRYKCKDCGEINPAEIHTCSPQTKPLSEKITEALNRKPLSDEDVWQVGRTLGYEFTNKNPNNVFLQFARAIEERHGIK